MTLDEAIKHCEEVATKNEETIAYYTIQGDKEWLDECEKDCLECASEHRQLAEWLKKLKAYEEAKEKIELKAEKCPQDEIRYGMRSALYVLDKCLEGSDSE